MSEFAKSPPEEYTSMAKQTEGQQPAVRRLGEMLANLADLMPRVVSNQMSLLQPYLGCGAHSLRGAIVSAVGSVLLKVNPFLEADGPQHMGAWLLTSKGSNALVMQKQLSRGGSPNTLARGGNMHVTPTLLLTKHHVQWIKWTMFGAQSMQGVS